MHARELELPTVRLATLRRLLAGSITPLVFHRETPLSIIEEALWDVPLAKVVLVDPEGALCGVLTGMDLPLVREHAATAESAMSERIVFLEPEHDVETAIATLQFNHAEYVVVALAGDLVGVLSRADLARATSKRRAA